MGGQALGAGTGGAQHGERRGWEVRDKSPVLSVQLQLSFSASFLCGRRRKHSVLRRGDPLPALPAFSCVALSPRGPGFPPPHSCLSCSWSTRLVHVSLQVTRDQSQGGRGAQAHLPLDCTPACVHTLTMWVCKRVHTVLCGRARLHVSRQHAKRVGEVHACACTHTFAM